MQDENRRILNKVIPHHFLDTATGLMQAFVFFFLLSSVPQGRLPSGQQRVAR
jgi:hypothetical protein